MVFLVIIAIVAMFLFVPNLGKFFSLLAEKTCITGGKAIAIGLDKADTELEKLDSRSAIEILESIGNKSPTKKK